MRMRLMWTSRRASTKAKCVRNQVCWAVSTSSYPSRAGRPPCSEGDSLQDRQIGGEVKMWAQTHSACPFGGYESGVHRRRMVE